MNKTPRERWRYIPDTDQHYSVSNLGRVRSNARSGINTVGRRFSIRSRILSSSPITHGHRGVCLYYDGRRKTMAIYLLVLSQFHGPRPSPKHVAEYIDGDQSNCRADNLRWVVPDPEKYRHPRGRPRLEVSTIRAIYNHPGPQRATAAHFGVSLSTVGSIRAGRMYSSVTGASDRRRKTTKIKNLPGERWAHLPGHDGRYSVSTRGRVKRNARQVTNKHGEVMLLRTVLVNQRLSDGSLYVRIYSDSDGTKAVSTVQKLMLQTFVGPPPSPKHFAVHLNGNRMDNRLANLEWRTEGNPRPGKLTPDQIRKVYASTASSSQMAKQYGVSASLVLLIRKGRLHRRITGATNGKKR